MRNETKIGIFFLVFTLLFCVAVAAAKATTTDPRIDAVASRIAQRPVHVWCYAEGEIGTIDEPAPEEIDTWGYVFTWPSSNVEHMANEVCEGVLGILNSDPTVPLWKEGLGALVLTHESYHLRLSLSDRINEANTECRAIRHVAYVIQFLGGSLDLARAIMPYALADHWYIALDPVSPYHKKNCHVPSTPGWPDGA